MPLQLDAIHVCSPHPHPTSNKVSVHPRVIKMPWKARQYGIILLTFWFQMSWRLVLIFWDISRWCPGSWGLCLEPLGCPHFALLRVNTQSVEYLASVSLVTHNANTYKHEPYCMCIPLYLLHLHVVIHLIIQILSYVGHYFPTGYGASCPLSAVLLCSSELIWIIWVIWDFSVS